MPMGPGGMNQSGPPPAPRSHNMPSDGMVGGGPPAPHMQNQMNGQMPGKFFSSKTLTPELLSNWNDMGAQGILDCWWQNCFECPRVQALLEFVSYRATWPVFSVYQAALGLWCSWHTAFLWWTELAKFSLSETAIQLALEAFWKKRALHHGLRIKVC